MQCIMLYKTLLYSVHTKQTLTLTAVYESINSMQSHLQAVQENLFTHVCHLLHAESTVSHELLKKVMATWEIIDYEREALTLKIHSLSSAFHPKPNIKLLNPRVTSKAYLLRLLSCQLVGWNWKIDPAAGKHCSSLGPHCGYYHYHFGLAFSPIR